MNLLKTIGTVGLAVTLAAYANTARGASPEVNRALAPAGPIAAAPQKPAPNAMGSATKAFQDRLREYIAFHNNVEKMVQPLAETDDPAKISDREKAMGAQLIKSRPDAKPGDFFIKEYQPYLGQIIKDDFDKRPIADRKALIQELPKGVAIGVNMVYPTVLPLATFPGNLLKKLPELPPELEYRIVGRHLVLRDVTGNVIVDIMRDVFHIPS